MMEALKLLRTYDGLKGCQVAKLLNISKTYLSEIETGKKQPNIKLLKKYESLFEIKVSNIMKLSEKLEENNEFVKMKIYKGIKKIITDL